jgi:HSP20 family protein
MNKDRKPNKKERNPTNPFDRFFRDPFSQSTPNIFDIFEQEFKRMQQEMTNFHQNSMFEQTQNQPRIYGWTYYVGPDGKPHYQEYNNAERIPTNQKPQIQEKNEPFIDVIDSDKEIYITAEIPGIEKENINVELTKDSLILNVKHPERGFNKEINLPAEINKKPVEAKYNNGVLSITLKKRKEKKKGHKINID